MDQPSPDPKPSEDSSPLTVALSRAGQLMVLLERHLDRAVGQGGTPGQEMEEVGRAWVRASQLAALLREVLPPGATESIKVDDVDGGPPAPD